MVFRATQSQEQNALLGNNFNNYYPWLFASIARLLFDFRFFKVKQFVQHANQVFCIPTPASRF